MNKMEFLIKINGGYERGTWSNAWQSFAILTNFVLFL